MASCGPSSPKASGDVELPLHIRWSGPPITYDLSYRADCARVYEQVLREGTESDVRDYVDAGQLRELFDELVLPQPVRRAWADWLRRQGARRRPVTGARTQLRYGSRGERVAGRHDRLRAG